MRKLDYIQVLNDLLLRMSLDAAHYVNMIIDVSLLWFICEYLVIGDGPAAAYEFSKNCCAHDDYIGKSGFIAGMAPVNE